MPRFRVELILDIPRATEPEVRDYVQLSVKCMGGSHHLDSPFFGLDYEQVQVVSCKKITPLI